MGNTASSETSRKSLPSRLPPSVQPPLPPLPPLPAEKNKLSKISSRPYSTAGLLTTSDSINASSTRIAVPARLPTPGRSRPHIATVSLTHASSSTPFPSVAATSRPLPSVPVPASPDLTGSVFTFEEAVAAVNGQEEPAYWRPASSSIYQTPNLDIELFQEQQQRQLDFEKRQWQSQFQFLQKDPFEKKQWPGRRRSILFRSRSTRRPMELAESSPYHRRNSIDSSNVYSTGDWNSWANNPANYKQAQAPYYGGSLSESWSQPTDTRASWNYNLSSYEAQRLLHRADDNMPVDNVLEQNSAASESKQSIISETAGNGSDSAHVDVPALHRASSDISLYAPVRRRSIMQVPGVATRRNSSSSLMAGGNSGGMGRPSFRHSITEPTVPGLHHQMSFESSASRVLSTPPPRNNSSNLVVKVEEPTPRPLTPCEGDYNTIGAFKLGSLRITNGTDSPSSPETVMTRKGDVDSTKPLDSPEISSIVARSQALAALSANSPVVEDDDDSYNKGLHQATPVIEDEQAGRNDSFRVASSPTQLLPSPILPVRPQLKSSTLSVSPATPSDKANPSQELAVEHPQIELSHDLFAGFDFGDFSLDDASAHPAAKLEPSPEILQTTSKMAAENDRLFDEESNAAEYASEEVLDVRDDSNAKSIIPNRVATVRGSVKSARTRSTQSVARSDSGFVSSPMSEVSQKHLSKADSGYGSNVSLKSFKQAASKLMAPVVSAKAASLASAEKDASVRGTQRDSFFIDELKLPGPTFDSPEMDFLTAVSHPASSLGRESLSEPSKPAAAVEPLPQREVLRVSPPAASVRPASSSAAAGSSAPTAASTKPASTMSAHTGRLSIPTSIFRKRYTMSAAIDTSVPIPNDSTAPSTPASTKSEVPGINANHASQKTNRLLRLLGVGANHSSDVESAEVAPTETVPDVVPVEAEPAEEKLSERTGFFPIYPKGLALKPQLSNNTLKTIFSVGSMEGHSTADLHQTVALPTTTAFTSRAVSPVAEESPNPLDRYHTKTANVADASVATEQARKISHRRSFLGLKLNDGVDIDDCKAQETEHGHGKKSKKATHVGKHQEGSVPPSPENILEVEAELTTYNSVNNSLGNNPYDAAFIAMHGDPDPFPQARATRPTGRTMSLTAQLERSLNMRLSFPRFSRNSTAYESVNDSPTGITSDDLTPSPHLPSPVFEGMLEQQRCSSMTARVSEMQPPPLAVSMRMQQIRPPVLRMPPPLRSQSTPPGAENVQCGSCNSSLESFHSATSDQYHLASSGMPSSSSVSVGDVAAMSASVATTSAAMVPPVQEAGGSMQGRPNEAFVATRSLRQRPSYEYMGNHSRREFLDQGRSNSMVSMPSHTGLGYRGTSGPPLSYKPPVPVRTYSPAPAAMAGESSAAAASMLRHRASFNGPGNGVRQDDWASNEAAQVMQSSSSSSLYNPPSIPGSYMDPYMTDRRRSGSNGSTNSDMNGFANIYQQRQQAAWEYYYQQNAHPPPYVPRAYHHRNRSSGEGHQAPYRILHSYNSPAYRGVPIWG